nr:immunoglobulin light chain junction region [Macaca mulatta]MOW08328.1 immunoglobulin light chain junction region [Macaca mulatta]MOW09279.1 immunoglobulin light chain junction region [Macaca mulatta]MOW10086.1 immunoglobulin light chain junction region [Macaca mulatta]MOW11266.1 immunoglobulin light chain junction region [Macaca mulatta]
CQHSYGIPWTF